MTQQTEWQDLPDLQAVAKAKADGWEIDRYRINEDGVSGWRQWNGIGWSATQSYRGRPRQPATKMIKMLCWFINGHLNWLQEGNHAAGPDWKRVPSEDKEIEVEE